MTGVLLLILLAAQPAGTAADLMAAAKVRLDGKDRSGARALYEQAAGACEASNDFACAGRAYNELGLMAFYDGSVGEVRRWYSQAAEAFERAGLARERAMAFRATTFDRGLSPLERLEAIDRAFAIAETIDDPGLQGLLRHSRGDIKFVLARYADSQDDLEAALVLTEQANNPGAAARVLTSLGRAFRLHGRPESALERYQRALALQERLKDLQGQAQTLNAIAISLIAMGDTRQAILASQRALALARQFGSLVEIRARSAGLGEIYVQAGRFVEAEPLLKEAIREYAESGGERFADHIYINLANVEVALGRFEQAVTSANKGIELTIANGQPEFLFEGYNVRAVAHENLGRLPEALADAIKAVDIVESLRTALVPEDALKQGFAETNGKVYSTLIRLLVKSGRHADALLAGERGRARAFLDLLATRSIASEERNTNTLLNRLRDPAAPTLRSFVSADPPRLDGVTAAARRLGSHIVTYWVDDDATTIAVVSPEGVVNSARVDIGVRRLESLVRGTWQTERVGTSTVATRGNTTGRIHIDDGSRAAFRQLYDALVLPVRRWLPARGDARLTIVPHGPLLRLSFAALTNERGQYLIEGYSVHYTPSVAVLELTAARPKAPAGAPNVLVADPDIRLTVAGETLSRLPAARREADGVAAALKTGQLIRLTGGPATEARVRELAQSARVLHFATHGIVPDDRPFEGFLALAGEGKDSVRDGRLTAREVYDLTLTADLVVLSGCRTARGQVTGDGVLGLSRAFLYAGTPSLMATLWDVYDEAGAHLLPSFYSEWMKSGDKAEALRLGQVALIGRLRAGTVRVATPAGNFVVPEHPAFWAGFVLIGEP